MNQGLLDYRADLDKLKSESGMTHAQAVQELKRRKAAGETVTPTDVAAAINQAPAKPAVSREQLIDEAAKAADEAIAKQKHAQSLKIEMAMEQVTEAAIFEAKSRAAFTRIANYRNGLTNIEDTEEEDFVLVMYRVNKRKPLAEVTADINQMIGGDAGRNYIVPPTLMSEVPPHEVMAFSIYLSGLLQHQVGIANQKLTKLIENIKIADFDVNLAYQREVTKQMELMNEGLNQILRR